MQLGVSVAGSVSANETAAVAASCFASTGLLPALGIEVSGEFTRDTAALLREARPEVLANLSGPVMAKASGALDMVSATLEGNAMTQSQLELLAQACQRCNITQWRLTTESLGQDTACGQISTQCDTPVADTCKSEFCQGQQFGNATNALIGTALGGVAQLREDLASVNGTLGLLERVAASLPSAVDGFAAMAATTTDSITCSFVKVAYTRAADALCGTAIDAYQTATNSVLGAGLVLSVMVCVQIMVNIRLGGVGSGPPPVRVSNRNFFETPGDIQLGKSKSQTFSERTFEQKQIE